MPSAPTLSPASSRPIVQSYRLIYRALLHAVQYSKPARYTARDQVREAFRKGNAADFDAVKIERTLKFLHGAARERGMEHRILKNLLMTAYQRKVLLKRPKTIRADTIAWGIRENMYTHYDMTVAMLNDSMGLCLR